MRPRSGTDGSMAGALAAVDVQDFAGHEAGDSRYSTASTMSRISPMRPTGCRRGEEGVRFGRVHRRLDDAGRHRVHADARVGVFDRQRPRDRVEAALGQRRQHGGHAIDGVIDQARRECTMWPPPCFSISRTARWVMWKKPARLTPSAPAKSASVYSVNGFAMKMPALLTSVSTRPNRAYGFSDHALRRPGIGDVAGNAEHVVVVRRA